MIFVDRCVQRRYSRTCARIHSHNICPRDMFTLSTPLIGLVYHGTLQNWAIYSTPEHFTQTCSFRSQRSQSFLFTVEVYHYVYASPMLVVLCALIVCTVCPWYANIFFMFYCKYIFCNKSCDFITPVTL